MWGGDWEEEHTCIELGLMDIVPRRLLVVFLGIFFLEFWDDQRADRQYQFLDTELDRFGEALH
jgi:hypothetical protein